MKKAEEYLKQYKPLKAHGTEYVHKQTAIKAIKMAQEDILKEREKK